MMLCCVLCLQIIAERVAVYLSRPVRNMYVWNTYPGALASLPDFSPSLSDYPFYYMLPDYVLTTHTNAMTVAMRAWIAAQVANYTRTSYAWSTYGAGADGAASYEQQPPASASSSSMLPVMTPQAAAWQYALYTAVIYARTTPTPPNTALYRLIKNLSKSSYLYQVSTCCVQLHFVLYMSCC